MGVGAEIVALVWTFFAICLGATGVVVGGFKFQQDRSDDCFNVTVSGLCRVFGLCSVGDERLIKPLNVTGSTGRPTHADELVMLSVVYENPLSLLYGSSITSVYSA